MRRCGSIRGTRRRSRCTPVRSRARDAAASWRNAEFRPRHSIAAGPATARGPRPAAACRYPRRAWTNVVTMLPRPGRGRRSWRPRCRDRRPTRPSGSCVRPVAACPSTGRSVARARSSTPSSVPRLAAEITLQPVRRYGVDAAVLYSDIIVPAHAVGFGIDVAPGTGPVAERPLRSRADLARLRPLEPDDIALRDRHRRAGARGAAARRARARLRRGAVHRRQLPRRGRPEPRRTATPRR